MQIPDWLIGRERDHDKNVDLTKIIDVSKEFTKGKILEDFTVKMMDNRITGYQDYYEYAQQ